MTPTVRHGSVFMAALIVAGLAASACGSGDASGSEERPSPQSSAPEVVEDPPAAPEGPAGVIVEVAEADLPQGFERINLYHDVSGYLRDMDDPILSELGQRSREPNREGGQGFANPQTGELVFVITIVLDEAEEARETISYIRRQAVERVFQFISPDETLFESGQSPGDQVGDGSVAYSLRYGAEEAGERTRDVATDLIVFATGGSVVFVLRSVNTADERNAPEGAVDLQALSQVISQRIVEALADQKASPTGSIR